MAIENPATKGAELVPGMGLIPTKWPADAVHGHQFGNTGLERLRVNNGGANPVHVSIPIMLLPSETPALGWTVPPGAALNLGPFPPRWCLSNEQGMLQFGFDQADGVTFELTQEPSA